MNNNICLDFSMDFMFFLIVIVISFWRGWWPWSIKSLTKPDLASSYDHINLSDLLNQTSTGHTLNFCIYKILYRSITKYKNKVRVNFEIWEKSASRAICSLQIDHCVHFLFVCLLWPVFYIFLFFLSGDPLIHHSLVTWRAHYPWTSHSNMLISWLSNNI